MARARHSTAELEALLLAAGGRVSEERRVYLAGYLQALLDAAAQGSREEAADNGERES